MRAVSLFGWAVVALALFASALFIAISAVAQIAVYAQWL